MTALMYGLPITPPPADPGEPCVCGDEELIGWRRERLRSLGYPHADADHLAVYEFDLHLLERLIAHGCPRATAFRIAA